MQFPTKAVHDILAHSPFLAQLSQFGFACADLPAGSHFLTSLRTEILSLQENQLLVPNWSRFVNKDTTTALQKTGIHEDNLPLDNPYSAPALEALWSERSNITNTINANTTTTTTHHQHGLPQLGLPSIKIQYNAGDGACFPCHFDSDASVDQRCLTFILYLNPEYLTVTSDAAAAQEQGGHFVAYPIPFPPVSFSPSMGRIVAFSSRNMLHRTLPCRSLDPRCCLTLWFPEAEEVGAEEGEVAAGVELDATPETLDFVTRDDFMPYVQVSEDDIAALNFLLEPDMRPHLARLMLAGEWIDSLRASHVDQQADVNTYIEKGLIQDLGIIEQALVGHVQAKGLRNWTSTHLRELSGKLPLNGERHQESNLRWWV